VEISNISAQTNSTVVSQIKDQPRKMDTSDSCRSIEKQEILREFCQSAEKLLSAGKADEVLKAVQEYSNPKCADRELLERFYLIWADAYIAKATYLSIQDRIILNQNVLAILAELEAKLKDMGGVEKGSKTYFELGSRFAKALVGSGNPDGAVKILSESENGGPSFLDRLDKASRSDEHLRSLYINSVLALTFAYSTGGDYAGEYAEAKTKSLNTAQKVLNDTLLRSDLTHEERFKLLKPLGDLYYERRLITTAGGIYRKAINELGVTPGEKVKGFKAYLELARCLAGRARPSVLKGTESDFTASDKMYDELLGVVFERQIELKKMISEKPDKKAEDELIRLNALYELTVKEKAAQHNINFTNFWAATDGFNEVVRTIDSFAEAGVPKDILSGFEFRSHYVLTYCYKATGREDLQQKELQKIWDIMTAWWWPTKEEFMSRQAIKYKTSWDISGSSKTVTDKHSDTTSTVYDSKTGAGSRTAVSSKSHTEAEKNIFENFSDRMRVGSLSFYLVEQANETETSGTSLTDTVKTAWDQNLNAATTLTTTIKDTFKAAGLRRIAPGMDSWRNDGHIIARVDVFYDLSESGSYESQMTTSNGKVSETQALTQTKDKKYKYSGFGVKFNYKGDRNNTELSANYDEVKRMIQAKISEALKLDEKGHLSLQAGLGATYDNNQLSADKITHNPDQGVTALAPEVAVTSKVDRFSITAGVSAPADVKHSSKDKDILTANPSLTIKYDMGEIMSWDVSPSVGTAFVFNRDGATSDTGILSANLALTKYQTSVNIGAATDNKMENAGVGISVDSKIGGLKNTRVIAGAGNSAGGNTYLSALLQHEKSDFNFLGMHLNAVEVFGGLAYTLDTLGPIAGVAVNQEITHRSPLNTQNILANAQYTPLLGPLFRIGYQKRSEKGELGVELNSRTLLDVNAIYNVTQRFGLGLGVKIRKSDEKSERSVSLKPSGIEFKEIPNVYGSGVKTTTFRIGPSLSLIGIPLPFALFKDPNPGTGAYLKDDSHFGWSNDEGHSVKQAVTRLYTPEEKQIIDDLKTAFEVIKDKRGIQMFIDMNIKIPEKKHKKMKEMLTGIKTLLDALNSSETDAISSVVITRSNTCEVKESQLIVGVKLLHDEALAEKVKSALSRSQEGGKEDVQPDGLIPAGHCEKYLAQGGKIDLKGVEDPRSLEQGLAVLGDLVEGNTFRLENLKGIVVTGNKNSSEGMRAEKRGQSLYINESFVTAMEDASKREAAIKLITGKMNVFDLRRASEIEEKGAKSLGAICALELHRETSDKYRVTLTDFNVGKDNIPYKAGCSIGLRFDPDRSCIILRINSTDDKNGRTKEIKVLKTEDGHVVDNITSDVSYELGFVETNRGKLSEAERVVYEQMIREFLEADRAKNK